MKYIIIMLFVTLELIASGSQATITAVDSVNNTAIVEIEKIDVGMSGVVVHTIDASHRSILKKAQVVSFDAQTHKATLALFEFNDLKNDFLAHGEWSVTKGDSFEFAQNYSRALLIAPSEEIYHTISKSVEVEWIHPDIFAAYLSYQGHPSPLKKDFDAFSTDLSIGLLFIYLDEKIYTLDMKSFKVLSVSDAALKTEEEKLPFYSRIQKISANWFGAGSARLQEYAPYYYKLLDIKKSQ